MMREMLQGKIHRGTVTDVHIDYPGSLTVDLDLIEMAGLLVHQKIQLLNITNGARLETYLIPGERGKREIIVNGAAARQAITGDRVIIVGYALYTEDELKNHQPKVVVLDERNQVVGAH